MLKRIVIILILLLLNNIFFLHFDAWGIISVEPPHAAGASARGATPGCCSGRGLALSHGTTRGRPRRGRGLAGRPTARSYRC